MNLSFEQLKKKKNSNDKIKKKFATSAIFFF